MTKTINWTDELEGDRFSPASNPSPEPIVIQAASLSILPLRLRPLSGLASPREVIRQFTPNWFAAVMGTGILALTLNQLPFAGRALHAAARGLWLADAGLFALFSLLYAARWAMFPREAMRIFGHSTMSMFLSCIPMGLATVLNGGLAFAPSAVSLVQTLWAPDALLALACGLGVPFAMFTRQNHAIERMTGVWLLPFVASEVAAVTGGLLAPHLADAQTRLGVLAACYALWACSVPMAVGILTILVLRMALHKLPPVAMAATSWLALGPIGTGALGLLVLGAAAPAILAANGLGEYGVAARGAGLVGGLLLWGYGLWWLAMAALITVRQLRQGLPFNLGWWGFTFPLGVYAAATLRLAALLPIGPLAVFGEALVVSLAAIWLLVAARTLVGAWQGDLFFAPCLAEE
jgi:C4-dicarboxylate transporter/malic acid transport protein